MTTTTIPTTLAKSIIASLEAAHLTIADIEEGGASCELCEFLMADILALKSALAAPQPEQKQVLEEFEPVPQPVKQARFCTCDDCKPMECDGCRINRESAQPVKQADHAKKCGKRIRDLALELEKTGRIISCLTVDSLSKSQERTDMVARNRGIQCAMEDAINELVELAARGGDK